MTALFLTTTATGICELVGVSAVILGGGHGWLQGQYGLAADQVLSARLVLPDGEAVTVSETSNPDFFWAIRGAGHNFGVVTEWQLRIYDMQRPKWAYEIFIFSGDKLEALFTHVNKMMTYQPPEAVHFTFIVKVPDADPDHVRIAILLELGISLTTGSRLSGTLLLMTVQLPQRAIMLDRCTKLDR